MQANTNAKDGCKLCSRASLQKVPCVWRAARGRNNEIAVCWILMNGVISLSEEKPGDLLSFPQWSLGLSASCADFQKCPQHFGKRDMSSLPLTVLPALLSFPRADLKIVVKSDVWKECCTGFLWPHLSSYPPKDGALWECMKADFD